MLSRATLFHYITYLQIVYEYSLLTESSVFLLLMTYSSGYIEW